MIGLVAHSEKPAAAAVLGTMVEELRKAGVNFGMERSTAALIGESSADDVAALAARCELLVVLGGDGTILRVVHKLGPTPPPLFGINIGSLGFLTCVGPSEVRLAVRSIQEHDYMLSARPLLDVRLHRADGTKRAFRALNDAVISRGERSQLVKIGVTINGAPLTEYNADGLIVATPTGSTAYSLSAGGPILMPESGGYVITPICPHVLTNRSVVVSDEARVEVCLSREARLANVSVDGQETAEMVPGDRLVLSKSASVLPLAMLPGRSFSEVLRQKLKWSGSNV